MPSIDDLIAYLKYERLAGRQDARHSVTSADESMPSQTDPKYFTIVKDVETGEILYLPPEG